MKGAGWQDWAVCVVALVCLSVFMFYAWRSNR